MDDRLTEKEDPVDRKIEEISCDPRVQQMGHYIQHGRVTTLDHCRRVARFSGRMNRKLHLHAKEDVLLRGAMLHDFYLYDWHNKDGGTHDWHGFIHADRAVCNAKKYHLIGQEEEKIIYSHMWPLNITRVPQTREAWIVCIADKLASLEETVFMR